MQEFRPVFFAAILMMAVSGCGGGGCNRGGDADTDGPIGDPCQAATAKNKGKYLCPEGYFCKYTDEKDMLDPHALGRCAAKEVYKPCMAIEPCTSQYFPRCETINESAYCDVYEPSKRCKCEKPGPFNPVEQPDEGDVKTPATPTTTN